MKRIFLAVVYFIMMFVSNVNAQSEKDNQIQTLVTNWHHDAAVANADAYFGAMTSDAIF